MNDQISRAMRQRDADHLRRNGAPLAAQLLDRRVVVELPSQRGWAVARDEAEARRLMALWLEREERRDRRVTLTSALLALGAVALGVFGLLEGWWG